MEIGAVVIIDSTEGWMDRLQNGGIDGSEFKIRDQIKSC